MNMYCMDYKKMLKKLPDKLVNTIITSPPYFGLRDYGVDGQIGLESTPEKYIRKLVNVFRKAKRVLRDDGTIWLNLGDSYAGSGKGGNSPNSRFTKQQSNKGGLSVQGRRTNLTGKLKAKNLIGIPWRVALALQADGWYLRSDIIWYKQNVMPESVTDRPTKAHEYIFLLSKSLKYYYDSDAIKEDCITCDKSLRDRDNSKLNNTPGRTRMSGLVHNNYKKRNKRDVWEVPTSQFKGAHFATFPEKLIEPCILAGCPEGGIVLDMFMGSGTTGITAMKHFRGFIGSEINKNFFNISKKRILTHAAQPDMFREEPEIRVFS